MDATFSRFAFHWVAALGPALLWLSGCGGPTSITDLRQNPYQVISFEVPADCGSVYLRITRRAQEQYRVITLATYQPAVSAKLAPDGQSATITLVDAGGTALHYILTADLRALDSARTRVDLYCGRRPVLPEANLWQKWAYLPLTAGKEPTESQQEGPKATANEQEK